MKNNETLANWMKTRTYKSKPMAQRRLKYDILETGVLSMIKDQRIKKMRLFLNKDNMVL